MSREDIIRMAREAGWDAHHAEFDTRIQTFAALVASAERERIKQANAPEIERINAHIKELEDAVKAEREACAKLLEEAAQAAKDVDPQGFVWIAIKTSAEAIRARGDKHD